MSQNYIIGGGLIALIAKTIYPSYKIIPIGKSVFYSLNPSLVQDNIIVHERIDDVMKSLNNSISPIMSRNSLSVGGQLLFRKNAFAADYLKKVYGPDYHPLGMELLQFEHFSYTMKSHILYKYLQNKFISELTNSNKLYGKIVSINNNKIATTTGLTGCNLPYDNIISTIPLSALANMCNIYCKPPTKDVHYTYVHAPSVDLEDSDTAYVADREIPFYRVSRRADDCYMFESDDKLTTEILTCFIKDATIVQQTVVKDALPMGDPPSLAMFDDLNILCVGSRAQHDDFMCVSSCIKRLL